jgi:hypothetical protein
MPWTTEDDVNIAEAPDVASAGSVSDVRGYLDASVDTPQDDRGVRHELRQFVFRSKPGALGPLAIDAIVTVNGVRYHYVGEAPHGPSIFEHLLLTREIA